MAARIQQHHGLPVPPTVVMNAPPVSGVGAGGSGDLRSALGLDAHVPILVYIGVSAPKRGLDTAVRGLPRLPGVHLALVTTRNAHVDRLEKAAAELGVADRLHVLPYVPVDDVVPFVATATAGLQSMVHVENYDVTIATKFFDYAQARLPIVQSDVRAMAALVRSIGCGEVFVAEDVDSFVAATSAVLADLPRYRAAYDRPGLLDAWTWEAQAGVLAELYGRVLAAPSGTPVEPVPTVGR
jgi:glycosyltransferase involved in cell wall biosynthesis